MGSRVAQKNKSKGMPMRKNSELENIYMKKKRPKANKNY
jgi:hypothetical protein